MHSIFLIEKWVLEKKRHLTFPPKNHFFSHKEIAIEVEGSHYW